MLQAQSEVLVADVASSPREKVVQAFLSVQHDLESERGVQLKVGQIINESMRQDFMTKLREVTELELNANILFPPVSGNGADGFRMVSPYHAANVVVTSRK